LKTGVRELLARKSLEFDLRRAGIHDVDMADQESIIRDIGNSNLSPRALRKRKIIVGKYREKFAGTRFLTAHDPILKALEMADGDHERDSSSHRSKGVGSEKLNFADFDPNSINNPVALKNALHKLNPDYDYRGFFRFGRGGELVLVEVVGCAGVDNNSLKLFKLFPDLKVLMVGNTGVTDISPIKNLQLDSLDLGMCGVEDLSPLKEMKTLTKLSISGTRVKSLAPLKGLSLEMLDISDTPITDIRPLSRMPLKGLRLTNCRLKSYMVLRTLKKLQALEPQHLWLKVPGKSDREREPQDFPDFRHKSRVRRGRLKR
jgi:hypothetical protein